MSKEPQIVKVKEVRPRLVSLKDAAKYLGLAEKTIRNRVARDSKTPFPFRPRKIGGKVVFELKDLDDYIDSL